MNNSRTRKNIMPVKTAAVPMYQLNEGTCYDVKSTGMILKEAEYAGYEGCLLYTSPSPRDSEASRMPSSA